MATQQAKTDALYDVNHDARRLMAAMLRLERAEASRDDLAISVALVDRDGALQDLRDTLSRTGPIILRDQEVARG